MEMAGFWYAAEPILPWMSLLVASSGSDEGSAFGRVRGGRREIEENSFGQAWAMVREDKKVKSF